MLPLHRIPFVLTAALAWLGLAAATHTATAQGCVIARGGGMTSFGGGEGLLEEKHWQVNVAHRWFKSDRHFVGTEEQKHRKAQGTEVINDSHFVDVTATYALKQRLWLTLTFPFVHHDRSSLYEHLGNASGQRFHTQAAGLADMRFGALYWMLDPAKHHRGNFNLGLSIKAPTGDYKATDTFIRPTGPQLRYVDSSIQPGDGGWGVGVEANGFIHLVGHLSGYANGSYLFNPRERVAATNFSVPDSYLLRAGVDYALPAAKGLALGVGLRWEGVPPEDVFGGSEGSRRPGYVISVEPGISFTRGKLYASVSVPIALERNRQRTYGATRTGDAAFADYTVNSTLAWRF